MITVVYTVEMGEGMILFTRLTSGHQDDLDVDYGWWWLCYSPIVYLT